MNLIPLDLELPEIFYNLDRKMKKHNPEEFSVIAGGSLSDFYMGHPFRDIDIFTTGYFTAGIIADLFQIEKEKITVFTKMESGYENFIEIPYIFRFEYRGYEIEIITTDKRRVFEFDFRFRQFYFTDGKLYASKEALEDIKNKELVIVNPENSISTFIRMRRFEDRFGFSVRKESRSFLLWYANKKIFSKEQAERTLQRNKRKLTKEQWSDLSDLLKNNVNETGRIYFKKGAEFPFHPSIRDLVFRSNEIALNYNLIEQYQPFTSIRKTMTLGYDQLKDRIHNLYDFYLLSRLKLIFSKNDKFQIPNIKKNELVTSWPLLFNRRLIEKMISVEDLDIRSHLHGGFFETFFEPLPETFEFIIEPFDNHENLIRYTLGDILSHNVLSLKIKRKNEEFKESFTLRACTNGKYTISESSKSFINGESVYLEAIGTHLKEKMGDFFDFHNENLVGKFRFTYYREYDTEHFFCDWPENDPISIDWLKDGNHTCEIPIRIGLKEKNEAAV